MHPYSRAAANFLLRAPTGLASRFRVRYLRLLGMRIDGKCRLARIEVPRNPWDVHLHHHVALDPGVVLLATGDAAAQHRIVIGPEVYVNRGVFFDATLSIVVGRHSMIGPYCYITDHDHGTIRDQLVRDQPLEPAAPVLIGHDVWLGAHVTVLKGVAIGDGAVIGAGSVVTRSIPENAIAVGAPARVIGHRKHADLPSAPLQHAAH